MLFDSFTLDGRRTGLVSITYIHGGIHGGEGTKKQEMYWNMWHSRVKCAAAGTRVQIHIDQS